MVIAAWRCEDLNWYFLRNKNLIIADVLCGEMKANTGFGQDGLNGNLTIGYQNYRYMMYSI